MDVPRTLPDTEMAIVDLRRRDRPQKLIL